MQDTNSQYDAIIRDCASIFLRKTRDYGTSWRVLRPISIIDQIFIKAQRIRNIQETGVQKVDRLGDDIASEFAGIINYAIIGLIQAALSDFDAEEMDVDRVEELYKNYFDKAKSLMEEKNHDYGEAWRVMSQESFVDLILMKLQRMKQIIANQGKTIASEGLDANFYDIINYGVFALIMIDQNKIA